MKYLLGLFVLGQVGTYLILTTNQNQGPQTDVKTISYESLNASALQRAQTLIQKALEQKPAQPQEVVSVTQSISGRESFANGMSALFSYLRSNQVLYRYELQNAFKTSLDRMTGVSQQDVARLNQEIDKKIDYHKKMIARLHFSETIKTEATRLLENLRSPLLVNEVKEVAKTAKTATENPWQSDLANIQNELGQISITKEMQLHESTPVTTNTPWGKVMGLWAGLLALAMVVQTWGKKSQVSDNQELINPTFKRIMSELDYPLVMVDQNLNVVWQNKKSEKSQFTLTNLQEMLRGGPGEEVEFKFDGLTYTVELSELAYKSGKKNTLIQLKPKLVSNKHLEHLIDTTEISSLLEVAPQSDFGDVNQSVAELAVKMGYLFKVSGKFLDLNFKPDLSDCFIESDRLEGMLKEFMMGCHHMVKDDSDVDGLYLRTDESANKFTISCFLNNFRSDALENHATARDFLRRFSILETKYAICQPMIDFQFKQVGTIKGLDVTLSFENRSQLETILSNVSANA